MTYSLEWTIPQFLKKYPEYHSVCSYLVHDKKYIVRTLHTDEGKLTELEFGYPGDKEWKIKPPKINFNGRYYKKPIRRL